MPLCVNFRTELETCCRYDYVTHRYIVFSGRLPSGDDFVMQTHTYAQTQTTIRDTYASTDKDTSTDTHTIQFVLVSVSVLVASVCASVILHTPRCLLRQNHGQR